MMREPVCPFGRHHAIFFASVIGNNSLISKCRYHLTGVCLAGGRASYSAGAPELIRQTEAFERVSCRCHSMQHFGSYIEYSCMLVTYITMFTTRNYHYYYYYYTTVR